MIYVQTNYITVTRVFAPYKVEKGVTVLQLWHSLYFYLYKCLYFSFDIDEYDIQFSGI